MLLLIKHSSYLLFESFFVVFFRRLWRTTLKFGLHCCCQHRYSIKNSYWEKNSITCLLKRFKVHWSSHKIDKFNWNKLLKNLAKKKFTFTFQATNLTYIAYITRYGKVITCFESFLIQIEKLSYSPFQCD